MARLEMAVPTEPERAWPRAGSAGARAEERVWEESCCSW